MTQIHSLNTKANAQSRIGYPSVRIETKSPTVRPAQDPRHFAASKRFYVRPFSFHAKPILLDWSLGDEQRSTQDQDTVAPQKRTLFLDWTPDE